MAYISNYQYYQNGGVSPTDINHGSYQYMSLVDIVNNFREFYVGEDKVIDNCKVKDIRFHAKQIIKKLYYDAFRVIKVMEIEVDSSGRAVMPHDYVDYIRVSYEKNGVLYTMHENNHTKTALAYLKDGNGDLVFDGDGVVEYDTSTLETARLTPGQSVSVNNCECTYYQVSKYGLDMSQQNTNPYFNVNQETGAFEFSSDLIGELIVVEYVSDGMQNGDDSLVVANKFFEDCIYLYIKWKILSNKKNTPVMIRQESKKEFGAEYSNSWIRAAKINPDELMMTLAGQQNWF